MMYASQNSRRILATPGAKAHCPICNGIVIAKCGSLKIWHWAHERNECDPWAEPITEWHLNWQREFPESWREVTVARSGWAAHRSDIKTASGVVIEFQHSALTAQEIVHRERFYRKMIWVFDATEVYQNDRFEIRDKGEYQTFRWKWPRLSIAFGKGGRFLDLGNGWMFQIEKMGKDTPCGGWGHLGTKNEFLRGLLPR